MSRPPALGSPRPYLPPKRERLSLSNGLKVVLVEDRRFPLITVRLGARGGAAHVARESAALADALADLATEGAGSLSARGVAEEAESFGGEIEASAGKDNTVLRAYGLAEHADRLFALLGLVARSPSFPEDEVDLRKRNMLEELALMRSQPEFPARAAFMRRVYGSHPYGAEVPTEEDIGRIRREGLQGLHRRLFAAENCVLAVAGAVGAAELRKLAERHLGALPRTAAEPLGSVPEPAEPEPPRGAVLCDRPGSDQSVLYVGHRGVARLHPDYMRLLLANQVLGGSFAARLMADLREEKGWTYGVYSRVVPRRSAGEFVVTTEVRTDATAAAVEAILKHVERLREEPAEAWELEQAKSTLIGRFVRALETQDGLADAVADLELAGLPADALETYVDRVQAVSIDDVRRSARERLDPGRMTVAVTGDAAQVEEGLGKVVGSPVVRVDQDGKP